MGHCLKQKACVGIDPGISKATPGASALIYDGGFEYFDWSNEGKVADNFRHWTAKYYIELIAIERQWARPTDSKQNISKIMKNVGIWIGICCAHGFANRLIYPTPQEWQKAMVIVPKGKDPKVIYLEEARKMFPTAQLKFKKHHGRAAALWIASYARRVNKLNVSRIN